MRVTFVLTIFILSSISFAKTYEVNTQHSFVNFELDYMQVSQVKGAFEKFQGTFDWDTNKEKLSDVIFEILVDSINTRDAKRDNHLKRKDFFYVEKFPVISFEGKKVVYENGLPVKVIGELEIRGVKKEHSFSLKWKGEYPDPVDKSKKSLFLAANTSINRKDFNIRWNKALDEGGWVVGDKVDIEVIIEANPTDSRPAFSRFYRKTKKILPGKLKSPQTSQLTPKNSIKETQEKKSQK